MKRNVWLVSATLLAVGALEFGILGSASAGATLLPSWLTASKGGPSSEREDKPPCPSHSKICRPTPVPTPVSPPPCLPDRQHDGDHACEQQPASIQLTPDPLAIHCDGVEHSTLTVRVTDAKGRPVANGTTVYFSAYNGTTMPPSAQTHGGVASTSVVFYGDLFKSGPNLIVDVGALEAGVRIRCFPASDQQPPSPPPCPVSPPATSPPCAPPPPPPCTQSLISPPCLTPTATPTANNVVFSLSPPNQTVPFASGSAQVQVHLDHANDVGAFEFILKYDPAVLGNPVVALGSFLGSTGRPVFCPAPIVDAALGSVRYGCASVGLGAGVSGSGVVATLTFGFAGSGLAAITFDEVLVTNPDADNGCPCVGNGATIVVAPN